MRNPTIQLKKTSTDGFVKSFFLPANLSASFVWTVWGAMLLIAISFIFIYGRNVPLAEDWHMVAPLTGNEPNLAKWLWLQNNEHRIPFPKLILLILLKITHGDFRSGMFLTILCIGFLAAAFIKVFNYIRGGKTIYADAFFPIVLLHIGNWENFFWSWEFTFIISVLLSLTLLIVVVQYQKFLTLRTALITAVCTICLPLCGANGLMCAMPVIPWLSYEAYLHFRSKEAGASRGVGIILSVAVVITLFIVLAYFTGYERPSWYPPSPGIMVTLKTALKFMALGLGPVVSSSWNLSIIVVLLLIFSAGLLLLKALFSSRNAEFRRALGLLFFLGGNIVFALAIGYGRAAMVPTVGLPMRYVLLAVPTLIICYITWELYGKAAIKKLIQPAMFCMMALLLYHNTLRGLGWRDYYINGTDAVTKDINQGLPAAELVAKHQQFLLHWDKKMLLTGMKQLKQAGMGPFVFMKEE